MLKQQLYQTTIKFKIMIINQFIKLVQVILKLIKYHKKKAPMINRIKLTIMLVNINIKKLPIKHLLMIFKKLKKILALMI